MTLNETIFFFILPSFIFILYVAYNEMKHLGSNEYLIKYTEKKISDSIEAAFSFNDNKQDALTYILDDSPLWGALHHIEDLASLRLGPFSTLNDRLLLESKIKEGIEELVGRYYEQLN